MALGSAELHFAAHAAVLSVVPGLEVAEVPVREAGAYCQGAPVAARMVDAGLGFVEAMR
jgi:hypothetical protein